MVTKTLRRAISFYSTIQAHDGHWPGDYGGPMFLLPGLVITLSVTGVLNAVLSEEHKKEMCRYIYNHQNQDGGWGLHIEGPSTMFGTVLSYVTLRLLGEGANDGQGAIERGRTWILSHGSATAITSWGKMWLSVLGAFEWSGNNPLPPEIWLLPYLLPVHPGFKEGNIACCGICPYKGINSCGGKRSVKQYKLCENASEYLFFDTGHLSEKAYQQFAEQMWSGTLNVTGPYNLKELFELLCNYVIV
ncbi:hypothetical protein ACB092_M003900 [Castanea dentata]